MKRSELANGECYHVYNRGVDKREVFFDDFDYHRFLMGVILLNDERDGLLEAWRNARQQKQCPKFADFRRLNLRRPLVEIIGYCLNPNHYHFILKQIEDDGIKKLMHRLGTSYTMYFNKKYKRSGALFQGRFKSVHVDSNEYFLYLVAYVSCNHSIHGLGDDDWKYASFREYGDGKSGALSVCGNINMLKDQFRNTEGCLDFLKNNADYLRGRKELDGYLLED